MKTYVLHQKSVVVEVVPFRVLAFPEVRKEGLPRLTGGKGR
jgi:hypothetical protein